MFIRHRSITKFQEKRFLLARLLMEVRDLQKFKVYLLLSSEPKRHKDMNARNLAVRGALAFGLPVLLAFAIASHYSQPYYFLFAGPLSGIVGGLAFGKRWGMPIVFALCFLSIGFMFFLQDFRSPWFSDVVWTGVVTGFLFWTAGGCAVLTLPANMRFNAAAAFAIPGTLAGLVFQFLYGPARYMYDLGSRPWWTSSPWEQLAMWLIAGIGGGWLMGAMWQRHALTEANETTAPRNRWAIVSVICAIVGLAIGAFYFFRWTLPLGLFNTLSPALAASDWFWGWGVLAASISLVGTFKPTGKLRAAGGLALAIILVVVSYRVADNPWKIRFNSNYAQKLLKDNGTSGDAIYTGNLILAQAALDNNDVTNAKQYLLQAATTPGAKRIEQNGLDMSVARALFERGEKDAVLEYVHRGRTLWPQGAQNLGRIEAAIKAGRRPNFNMRGPGGAAPGQPPNPDR
jgi:hypothetical protein